MNRKYARIALLAFASLIFIAGCAQTEAQPIELPTESAQTPTNQPTVQPTPTPKPTLPQIDGTILPGEWAGAYIGQFADGSELLMIQTADTLYLAIRAGTAEMIAGNVFVQSGGEVRILHTSAALGTAIYQNMGEVWAQTKGFSWCCRDTVPGETLDTERAAFLEQEGWVGINSRIGAPNEIEYQISLGEEDFRLAVNFLLVSNPDEKSPFPAEVTDDCTLPTPGSYPAEFHFSPETWFPVSVTP